MPMSDQEVIVEDLIYFGQYRKLAEFVLLKDRQLEAHIFDAIGALRETLLEKLNHIKNNDVLRILEKVKSY